MFQIFLWFSLCYLLVPSALAQTKNCPSGNFFNVTTSLCQICPAGTARSKEMYDSKVQCEKCPPGTFSSTPGLEDINLCRPCYDDTFTAQPGSTSCETCPPGTIANRGSKACLKCGPGSAASAMLLRSTLTGNPSQCVSCPKGTYSDEPNNRECKQCPKHMTSPRQATSISDCRPCPPGSEAFPGSDGCERCSRGRFRNGTMERCVHCPAGTITPEAGAASCQPCPKGTRESPQGAKRTKCVPCSAGTTTMAKGARFCRTIGAPCPLEFFETNNGDCNRCEPGHRYNELTETCDKCPSGTVSRGSLEKACKECPPGQRADPSQTKCICQDGEQFGTDGSCENCPPGTFSNSEYFLPGALSDTDYAPFETRKCEVGFFADKPGSSYCKRCPPGTVAPQEGSTKCMKCPPGLVPHIRQHENEEEGFNCVTPATGCPLGWTRTPRYYYNAVFGCIPVPCLPGTPKEDIGTKCTLCMPGERINDAGTRCIQCPFREVSEGGIITECKKCEGSLERKEHDPSKCGCTRYGWGIQDGICKRCPRGSFSDTLSEVCTKCPPGSRGGGFWACVRCPRNTIARNPGAKKCQRCPEGTVSDKTWGGRECIAA